VAALALLGVGFAAGIPTGLAVGRTVSSGGSELAGGLREAEPAAALVPAAAPAPAEVRCPPGMLLVRSRTIHIAQPRPRRAGWPTPDAQEIAPIDVAAFCIDRREVSLGDYLTLSDAEVSAGDDACKLSDFDNRPAGPVVCVRRDSAARHCEARDPPSRLPTIVEWEAIARDQRVRESLILPTPREWVADAFPPEVFNRHAGPGADSRLGMFRQDYLPKVSYDVDPQHDVMYSWNRESRSALGDLGFRCAFTPGG